MKNIFTFIGLLLFVWLLSCTKQADPLDLPSIQPNNMLDTLISMTAQINGKKWQTDSVTAYSVMYAYDSNKSNLLVIAKRNLSDSGTYDSTTTTITFTISQFNGPNTYTIAPPAVSAAYYIGTQRFYATSGQINITADSNYAILGAINFVADTFTITNGVFNVETP